MINAIKFMPTWCKITYLILFGIYIVYAIYLMIFQIKKYKYKKDFFFDSIKKLNESEDKTKERVKNYKKMYVSDFFTCLGFFTIQILVLTYIFIMASFVIGHKNYKINEAINKANNGYEVYVDGASVNIDNLALKDYDKITFDEENKKVLISK